MEKPTSAPQSGSVFGVKKRGTASKMLESRGFGWLLDEEDLDEEDQKPLLYVVVWLFYSYCMCTFVNYIHLNFFSILKLDILQLEQVRSEHVNFLLIICVSVLH